MEEGVGRKRELGTNPQYMIQDGLILSNNYDQSPSLACTISARGLTLTSPNKKQLRTFPRISIPAENSCSNVTVHNNHKQMTYTSEQNLNTYDTID